MNQPTETNSDCGPRNLQLCRNSTHGLYLSTSRSQPSGAPNTWPQTHHCRQSQTAVIH